MKIVSNKSDHSSSRDPLSLFEMKVAFQYLATCDLKHLEGFGARAKRESARELKRTVSEVVPLEGPETICVFHAYYARKWIERKVA